MQKSLGALIAFIATAAVAFAQAPVVEWTKTFGTNSIDQAMGVATDYDGSVYVAGRTSGSLDGENAGSYDVFLRKYSRSGSLQWKQQVGGGGDYQGWDVVVDTLGHAIVVGHTTHGLSESTNGSLSAFVAKFDPSGQRLWTQQFSDNLGSQGLQVAVDAMGNIFASGLTVALGGFFQTQSKDAFITKLDPSGTRQWTQRFGSTRDDIAWGVSADAQGNAYVSGETQDDTFLRKYDPAGLLIWERKIEESAYVRSQGVSTDALGNVYITGNTAIELGQAYFGRFDAFVAKYDSEGSLAWIRQLGSSENDNAEGVSTDGQGNVYVTGFTHGDMAGTLEGGRDFYVAKYNSAGDQVWVEQLSTSEFDNSSDIAADGLGNAYVAGVSLNANDLDRDNALLLKLRDDTFVPHSADFNDDGAVGHEDLLMWQTSFGTDAQADADGDGNSDGLDFLTWQGQFSMSFRPSASAAPEPGSSMLVAWAGIVLAICRRHGKPR